MLKRMIVGSVLGCIAMNVLADGDLTSCPAVIKHGAGVPPFDYQEADKRVLMIPIERRHFYRDVEMVNSTTATRFLPDVRYMLDISPNHHRALQSMVRVAIQTKSSHLPGLTYSVDCYLQRAIDFSPRDVVPQMIMGQYLASQGKPSEALKVLLETEKQVPADANLAYNIGLLLVDLKRYNEALEYAHRAYRGGFPLPGLRDKLKRAGVWREPESKAPEPAPAASVTTKQVPALPDAAAIKVTPELSGTVPSPVTPPPADAAELVKP